MIFGIVCVFFFFFFNFLRAWFVFFLNFKNFFCRRFPLSCPLPVVAEQDLQPARTRRDELSGITRPPALGEADPDAVGVVGPVCVIQLGRVLQQAGLLIVKHLDGVARHHLAHDQGPAVGDVQRGRVDEDGMLAAVVGPHPVRFLAQ